MIDLAAGLSGGALAGGLPGSAALPQESAPHSLFASVKKRTGRGRSKRKNAFDERAAHPGRPFVCAGVVRSGLAGVDGPVDPAPDRFREEHGPRITTLGGQTGRETNGPAPLSAAAHLVFDESPAHRGTGPALLMPGMRSWPPPLAVGADFYIRPLPGLSPGSGPAAAKRGADQVDKHPRPTAAGSIRQQKPSTVRERRKAGGTAGPARSKAERAERGAETNAIFHPVPLPQSLCGDQAFRLPE